MVNRDEHYTLMPLLFGLTLVSGLIDATSYLALGRVFVANMTGNVVLTGFAIAGAPDISIVGSLIALAAFMLGGVVGGRLSRSHKESSAHLLTAASIAKIFIMLLAAAIAFFFGSHGYVAWIITFVLGISMGLQNAVVRAMAIPDITTTVVTQTIIGIAMDSTFAGGNNTRLRRRVTSVVIMFIGALLGAFILYHLGVAAALATAALIIAIVSVWAWKLASVSGVPG
jgi:uncharacterized membrane protein YoaK (UPF0700 family)